MRPERPPLTLSSLPAACAKPILMLWAEAVFTSSSLLTGFTVLAGDTFHSQEEPATWRRSVCSAGFLRSQMLPTPQKASQPQHHWSVPRTLPSPLTFHLLVSLSFKESSAMYS